MKGRAGGRQNPGDDFVNAQISGHFPVRHIGHPKAQGVTPRIRGVFGQGEVEDPEEFSRIHLALDFISDAAAEGADGGQGQETDARADNDELGGWGH